MFLLLKLLIFLNEKSYNKEVVLKRKDKFFF